MEEGSTFNYKLRAARNQHMWTIPEAAEQVGVDAQTFWRWENYVQRPRPYPLRKLCEVFGRSAEALGFGIPSDHLDHAPNAGEAFPGEMGWDETVPLVPQPSALTQQRSAVMSLTGEEAEVFLALLGDETIMKQFDPAKRHTLQQLFAAGRKLLVAGVAIHGLQFVDPAQWEQLERLARALKKPSSIDGATLHGLKSATESYWQLRIHGSLATPDLLDTVIGHYQTVTRLLQGSLLPTTRTFLSAVASETALLAGMLFSADLHKHKEAQSYYNTALVVAQQANNDALYAAGLGRMGALASTIGEPKEACALLREAQRFVMHDDAFTLRAWLAAEEAEIQAAIAAQEHAQNTSTCFKALEKVEMYASQIGLGEDTFGMYFDASRIPAYRGSCNLRFHHPDEALEALKEALEPLEPSGALRRAVLLDLAEASIQATAVEQACDYLKQVLEIIVQIQATSSLQRVYGLRQQLEPWSTMQEVKDLDEQLTRFDSGLM